MDPKKEREENKKKVIWSVICAAVTLLGSLTIIILTDTLAMPTWLRTLLIVDGLIVLLGGLLVCAWIDRDSGPYECMHCQPRFTPSYKAYLLGMHTITTRRLRCPKCGKKSLCRRRLNH